MQTRREFLKQSTMAGGALALLAPACSQGALPPAPSQPVAPAVPPPVLSNPGAVQLVIAKWQGATQSPEVIKLAAVRLTEKAVQELAGLAQFIKKGATIWIKPNINFHRPPEFAANTNPDVVATVVRLCLEAGAAKVRVRDHSAFGADKSYPMSGIEEAARAAGAEEVYLDETKFKEYPIKGNVMQT